MKRLIALNLILIFISSFAAAGVPNAWKGEIPSVAAERSQWSELIEILRDKNMPYGAMAASARVLAFFNDLGSKEAAYRAIIDLLDRGYPQGEGVHDSTIEVFIPGDIEARGDREFAGTYNFVKYALSLDQGMNRWARAYFEKMGDLGLPRYQYFLSMQSYAKGTVAGNEEAISHLKEILRTDSGKGGGLLAVKAARTLARIFYEQKKFEKSLDIYSSFLLRLNPIQPSDWLETAWNLYFLKRFPEALGMLYNLESKAQGPRALLEKLTLRALIYRENCAIDSANALAIAFDNEFGEALSGLKKGGSPRDFAVLAKVADSNFARLKQISAELQLEREAIGDRIPSNRREIAEYLYRSESQMIEKEIARSSESALNRAAETVITVSEQLKFLKYDVAREKYDPDRIFSVGKNTDEVRDRDPIEGFQVKWPQSGEYWRNERETYRGVITQQCGT